VQSLDLAVLESVSKGRSFERKLPDHAAAGAEDVGQRSHPYPPPGRGKVRELPAKIIQRFAVSDLVPGELLNAGAAPLALAAAAFPPRVAGCTALFPYLEGWIRRHPRVEE